MSGVSHITSNASNIYAMWDNRVTDIGKYDIMDNLFQGVGYATGSDNSVTWLRGVRTTVDGGAVIAGLIISGTTNQGASGAGTSYNSFKAFKKANPVKTQGNQWHHIVEQNQVNKSGFSVQQINNTNNLIELTPSQHSQLSGFYSSKPDFAGGLTVRDWLAGQSFETQYKFGIDKLKEFGFMK